MCTYNISLSMDVSYIGDTSSLINIYSSSITKLSKYQPFGSFARLEASMLKVLCASKVERALHTNMSVCRGYQTAGRSSCSSVSGDVSNRSCRRKAHPVTSSRLSSA